jgi:hypothetical protein
VILPGTFASPLACVVGHRNPRIGPFPNPKTVCPYKTDTFLYFLMCHHPRGRGPKLNNLSRKKKPFLTHNAQCRHMCPTAAAHFTPRTRAFPCAKLVERGVVFFGFCTRQQESAYRSVSDKSVRCPRLGKHTCGAATASFWAPPCFSPCSAWHTLTIREPSPTSPRSTPR